MVHTAYIENDKQNLKFVKCNFYFQTNNFATRDATMIVLLPSVFCAMLLRRRIQCFYFIYRKINTHIVYRIQKNTAS